MEDGKWQDGKSLAECNRYMLDNCVSTDVMFIVGEDRKEVRAHKYVLGSRSSVFYAMLFGPMAETTSSITIPDIEPDIFSELLRFLYYEDLSITTANMTSLVLAADKYNVTGVVNKCEQYMNSTLTVDSVCAILNCAVLLNKEDLKKKCQTFIFKNACLFFQSSSFPHLHRDNLKMILQSDDTFITEELIYECVLRWGERRCEEQGIKLSDVNIKGCLGDLLDLIRFPKMDIEYFASKVSKYNVLTKQEKINVYEGHFLGLSKQEAGTDPASRSYWEFVCIRGSKNVNKGWVCLNGPDRLDFTVSQRIAVLGFVMNAPGTPAQYEVEAQLLKSSDVLALEKTVVNTSEGEETFKVMFRSGVIVQSGFRYTASVNMVGPKSFGCSNCKPSVTANGVQFQFYVAAEPNNYTNVTAGQIPGVIFTKMRQ